MVCELEVFWSSLDLTLDTFNQLTQVGVSKILDAIRPPTSLNQLKSSFCQDHGTKIVLVTLMDNLHRQRDQGGLVLLFLLELRAVFNMTDYDLLTHFLADAGIWGIAL